MVWICLFFITYLRVYSTLHNVKFKSSYLQLSGLFFYLKFTSLNNGIVLTFRFQSLQPQFIESPYSVRSLPSCSSCLYCWVSSTGLHRWHGGRCTSKRNVICRLMITDHWHIRFIHTDCLLLFDLHVIIETMVTTDYRKQCYQLRTL